MAGVRPNSHNTEPTFSPCGKFYLSGMGQWVPLLSPGDRVLLVAISRRRGRRCFGRVLEVIGHHVSGSARVRYYDREAKGWLVGAFPLNFLQYEPTPERLAKVALTIRQSWSDPQLRNELRMPMPLLNRGMGPPEDVDDESGAIKRIAVGDALAAIWSDKHDS